VTVLSWLAMTLLCVASRYKTDGAWRTFIDHDKFHQGFVEALWVLGG